MKFIKKFKLYERSLQDAKKELNEFQEELDIESTLEDLISSIDGIKLSVETIFPFLKKESNIEELNDNSNFLEELNERGLKTSEYFNSEDFNTFSRIPLKWLWVYEINSSDMEIPIYILLQYWKEKKEEWSNIKLYYVQQNIENFLEELSQVTLEIRQKVGDKKWIYITSNSGEDWNLQNIDDVTSSFRRNLNWDDIIELSKHPDVELAFY